MKNNSFLTSLSKDLVRDVRDLMAGNSSVEEPLEELGEAAKTLTAKQKKHIDKNKNGKIDADDFHRLRNEGIDRVVIHSPYTPDIHGGLAEVTHRDLRTGVVTVMFENMYYKLKKGQFKELPEEFEQLDELSRKALASYIPAASKDLTTHTISAARGVERDNYNPKKLARNRRVGIETAANKLAKEEVEELDEKTAYQPKMVKNPISGKMVPDGSFIPPKTMPKDKYNPVIGGPGSKEKKNMISALNKPKNKNEKPNAYYKEETEELDEGKIDPAKSASALVNHFGVSDEVKRNKDGSHRFYRGFFYRSGSTSEGHAKKVSNQLNAYGIKHDIVDHGTQDYKPFKGGASVKTQNHHWVDVKIHPGQKINLDESVELDELNFLKVHKVHVNPPKALTGGKVYKEKPVDPKKMDAVGKKISDIRNTKEEVENLDEISAGMAQSYLQKKRERDYNTSSDGTTHTLKKPTTLNRLNRDIKGTVRALRTIEKTKNEEVEVELSQDEIDNIEAILSDLDEGRGRPPKEGSEAWKRRQTQAAEDVPALGIQLRKAASINKPVTFANGESKQIHPDHINRFNDHMDARKTSQQKAEFQKTANKSHADFVKAVTADIPHRAKDTGEIVKYGK